MFAEPATSMCLNKNCISLLSLEKLAIIRSVLVLLFYTFFLDPFYHHRYDLVEVADDFVMRYAENRGVGVVVDCDDFLALRHSRLVLDCSADPDGDIEARPGRRSRL